MNKKTIWGIIVLVAVLLIIAVVFMVDEEGQSTVDPADEITEDQVDSEGEELLWELEDEFFYAYDLIYEREGVLPEEELSNFSAKYDELEMLFWELEDEYFMGEIGSDEFEERLEEISTEIELLIEELEN